MMSWQLLRGDARRVSDLLEPASVDLIVTSPPYFALRSYRDDGEHYGGQLGSEATPGEFIDALIECTADWLKVLKPGGSIFVNLGDKRAGSGGHNNNGLGKSTLNCLKPGYTPPYHEKQAGTKATRRNAPDRYNQNSEGIPAKSLMGLPWRYANACVDRLGLILRADIVWHKPNGLPESVTDRVRQSHEYWFHLTREARYFAAVDEVREAHARLWDETNGGSFTTHKDTGKQSAADRNGAGYPMPNPLGKLPGSVWTYDADDGLVGNVLAAVKAGALEPDEAERILLGDPGSHEYWFHLTREARYFASVDEVREATNPDNAAHATRYGGLYPDPLRQGGSNGDNNFLPNPLGKLPGSVWTIPSEPLTVPDHLGVDHFAAFPSEWPRRLILGWSPTGWCEGCGTPRRPVVEKGEDAAYGRSTRGVDAHRHNGEAGWGMDVPGAPVFRSTATILGYACACPDTAAPIRPSVILDPFCGTGTTPAVAHHLGRHGIGIDLSRDYLRLAEWRCTSDTALRDKVLQRSDLPKAPVIDGQLALDFL